MNFVEVIGNYDKQRKGRGRILIFALLIFVIVAIYLLSSFVDGFSSQSPVATEHQAINPTESSEIIVASPQSTATELVEPSSEVIVVSPQIVASPETNSTEVIEAVPSADIQATQRAAMSQAIRGSR